MNKLFSIIGIFLFVNAYAIPQGPCGPCATCGEVDEVCCERPRPGPHAFSYPKDKNLACGNMFYFYGDFLLLQAMEDGLEYAISDSPCDPLIVGIPQELRLPVTNGQTHGFSTDHRNWHWNPGFRIGVGHLQRNDEWFHELVWTHVNITNSTSMSLDGTGRLIPLWMTQRPIVILGEPRASCRWAADFNTIDCKVATGYHISRYLAFTPHFGLRFAIIDQYYNAQYSSQWNEADGAGFNAHNDFWGIGGRVGLDTEWALACNAGFYADFSASMLYGWFCVSEDWEIGSVTGGYYYTPRDQSSDLSTNFYQNVANFEVQMGIWWATYFCDMQYRVSMKLGWEFHYWYDQNQMRKWNSWGANTSSFYYNYQNGTPTFNNTLSRGDLTLQGLVYRLQFDF